MFCKNCGAAMNPAAAVCVTCGAAKGTGASYCENCGQPINPGAAVCIKCGAAVAPSVNPAAQKSKMTAGLLGIFLGGLGVHNFYLGYTGKAIGQIALTCCFGLGYIWGFIEGVMILCGKIDKDANGVPLKD